MGISLRQICTLAVLWFRNISFVSVPRNLINAVDSQKERRALDTKRLDLDAAKSRLKRAKSLQTRESVS